MNPVARGVPLGSRSPRKRGPYCAPLHIVTEEELHGIYTALSALRLDVSDWFNSKSLNATAEGFEKSRLVLDESRNAFRKVTELRIRIHPLTAHEQLALALESSLAEQSAVVDRESRRTRALEELARLDRDLI